jgi:hypothetical protein
MRDAVRQLGGDPMKINPICPVDLVIDHSVQVDSFGRSVQLCNLANDWIELILDGLLKNALHIPYSISISIVRLQTRFIGQKPAIGI